MCCQFLPLFTGSSAPGSDADAEVRARLMERIATVTPFLKILTDVIEFGSWAGSAPGSGSGSRPGSCSGSGPGSWSGWIKLDGRHMCSPGDGWRSAASYHCR